MGNTFSRRTYFLPINDEDETGGAGHPDEVAEGKKKKCRCCPCCPARKKKSDESPMALYAPRSTVIIKPFDPDSKPIPNDSVVESTPTAEKTPLVIENINLNVAKNAAEHHTTNYFLVSRKKETGAPVLVIRRGHHFTISLLLNRPLDKSEDVINFVFTIKDTKTQPTYAQGTIVSIPLVEIGSEIPGSWHAKLITTADRTAEIHISSPQDALVGAWSLDIDTRGSRQNVDQIRRHSYEDPIYILFNPWCTSDSVYMPDEAGREEYVLSDSGMIWRGTHSRFRPCPWTFAQFDEGILETAVYLLNKIGKLRQTERGDPVLVVRHLSAAVNANDDVGVLVGNWSGKYDDGECPTKWAGSFSILDTYGKTHKPIKYGQCWVFSGILTTVCRALGIPCRPVTNYQSAHDTHESLTVDYFCDDKGELLSDLNADSIWNFHVWNEVWMQRADLEPGGYGGWQAIDATPQEQSDGLMRCGPASLAAIKRGEVKKLYDTEFLYAEVNADKVYWRFRGTTQPLKLLGKISDSIGLSISTKAIGKYEREDITYLYKHPEHSEGERSVMLEALRQCGSLFSRYYLNDCFEDIQFDLELRDDIIIGNPFKVTLKVKNKHDSRYYTISAHLRVNAMLYSGKVKKLVKENEFDLTISGNESTILDMDVTYDDYCNKLEDQYCFNITAVASVASTGFEYFAQDDFRVRVPDIKIDTDGNLAQGQEFSVRAHFVNPLPKALRKGQFTIDGPGLGNPLKILLKKNIEKGETAEVTCKLTPKLAGSKTIVAKFVSKELRDVDGYAEINIRGEENLARNGTVSHPDIPKEA